MTDETQAPPSNLSFWFIVGLEVLAVPLVVLVLFFSLTIERPSSAEVFFISLLAAYPFLLLFVGFYGRSLLKRNRRMAAHLLALSPLLILGPLLVNFASV